MADSRAVSVAERGWGYDESMLVGAVAVLVMLLMLGDVVRMLFVDE